MSDRLAGVHPELVAKAERIMATMSAFGAPMFPVQGVRTTADQQSLWAQGRTKPGAIVTNCDGVAKRSNHQMKADGYGHALDLAFVDNPHTSLIETWDDKQPWAVYGALAESLGLVWGGRFKSIQDKPHIELPVIEAKP